MNNHEDEIREMRKAIHAMAYQGFFVVDAPSKPFWPFGQSLVRNTLDSCRYRGLSGEDTMTVLAYNVLKEADRIYEQLLGMANIRTEQFIIADTGKIEPDARHVVRTKLAGGE